jgi:hypothetical protein
MVSSRWVAASGTTGGLPVHRDEHGATVAVLGPAVDLQVPGGQRESWKTRAARPGPRGGRGLGRDVHPHVPALHPERRPARGQGTVTSTPVASPPAKRGAPGSKASPKPAALSAEVRTAARPAGGCRAGTGSPTRAPSRQVQHWGEPGSPGSVRLACRSRDAAARTRAWRSRASSANALSPATGPARPRTAQRPVGEPSAQRPWAPSTPTPSQGMGSAQADSSASWAGRRGWLRNRSPAVASTGNGAADAERTRKPPWGVPFPEHDAADLVLHRRGAGIPLGYHGTEVAAGPHDPVATLAGQGDTGSGPVHPALSVLHLDAALLPGPGPFQPPPVNVDSPPRMVWLPRFSNPNASPPPRTRGARNVPRNRLVRRSPVPASMTLSGRVSAGERVRIRTRAPVSRRSTGRSPGPPAGIWTGRRWAW